MKDPEAAKNFEKFDIIIRRIFVESALFVDGHMAINKILLSHNI